MMITIKLHHFIDIITRLGDEDVQFQPHPYGHAVQCIAHRILANHDVTLCIEFGSDDICAPCCHHEHGTCNDTIDTSFRPEAPTSKQAYNLLIDARWSERLGLKQGDRLTAREFAVRIRARAGDIEDIYCETPPERTETRQAKLQKGVVRFLETGSSQRSSQRSS